MVEKNDRCKRMSFFDYRNELLHRQGLNSPAELISAKHLRRLRRASFFEPYRRVFYENMGLWVALLLSLVVGLTFPFQLEFFNQTDFPVVYRLLFEGVARIPIGYGIAGAMLVFAFWVDRKAERFHYANSKLPALIVSSSKNPEIVKALIELVDSFAAVGGIETRYDWDGSGHHTKVIPADHWRSVRRLLFIFEDPFPLLVGRSYKEFRARKVFFDLSDKQANSTSDDQAIDSNTAIDERSEAGNATHPVIEKKDFFLLPDSMKECVQNYEPIEKFDHQTSQIIRALLLCRDVAAVRRYFKAALSQGAIKDTINNRLGLAIFLAMIDTCKRRKVTDTQGRILTELFDKEISGITNDWLKEGKDTPFSIALADFDLATDPIRMEKWREKRLKSSIESIVTGKLNAPKILAHHISQDVSLKSYSTALK
ncbi:hypothetical protein [Kordiimonas sp.]|uniref:hypothetical protein n=1 Tax=Kordiimonas sp. TaxID=1970157 RepID=UPI003A9401AB